MVSSPSALRASSIMPVNGATSITAIKGEDAIFQWNIVLLNYAMDAGLKLLNGTTELWIQQTGQVTEAGKALFQDKLTVEKTNTFFKTIIRNVNFNESSVELRLIGVILDSRNFQKISDIDSTIKLNVKGKEMVMLDFLSIYIGTYPVPCRNFCVY